MYDYNFPDATMTTWVLLRQTWSAMEKAAERRLAKTGLTPEQVHVLWICRDYPGLLTTAQIARLLSRQSQTVTGLLNRLERKGLLKRVPRRKGKPFTEIKITDKGTEAVGPAIEVARALMKEIMSTLSAREHEDVQRVLRVLQRKTAELLQVELTSLPGDYAKETIPV